MSAVMNGEFAPAAVETFLAGFSTKTRRRGQECYDLGTVLEVACLKAGAVYTAIVEGSQNHRVRFVYDPRTGSWDAECTCPSIYSCPHAYAGMLALKANAPALAVKEGDRFQLACPKVDSRSLRAATPSLPPPSPLALALRNALGRTLEAVEFNYLQVVEWLFNLVRGGRPINEELLGHLAPRLEHRNWGPLSLWPTTPRDAHEFWLYCAWELRRRGLAIPPFMQPVTHFEPIEPAMKSWERQKEIAFWQGKLNAPSTTDWKEPEPVDFRIVIHPSGARLQWKRPSDVGFKELKPAHMRRLHDEHRTGTLAIVPQAAALWLSFYNPYEYYASSHLDYRRPETARTLSPILRLPQLADRIVTPDGKPLARPAEPLAYRLEEAKEDTDDYRITLAHADGSPAPRILLVVPGAPPVYVAETAVYEGPQPHGFNSGEPLRIPAPALESSQGLVFLRQLKLPTPSRIAARIRVVKMAVKLACELKPLYPGSETEGAFIEVQARAADSPPEYYTGSGWYVPAAKRPAQSGNGSGASKDFIPVEDRSTQQSVPALIESLGARWEQDASKWRVRVTKSFPETFVRWLESLPPDIEVQLDPDLATLRNAPVAGQVRLDVDEAGVDWFDLKVALQVSDLELTPEELKLLLNARGRFVRLGSKGWKRLQFNLTPEEDERLARLGLDARDFTAEPQRLHALQLADPAARKFLPEQQADAIHRRASELKTRVAPPVPGAIRAHLRPYQLDGFHFLAYLTANHFGGVLADDMGLGKTLQTLTWLAWLHGQGSDPAPASSADAANLATPDGAPDATPADPAKPARAVLPSLVVCPKSVMDNWRAEVERFCPALRVRVWKGEPAEALASARQEADLIVLNYAQLRSLTPQIAEFRWCAAILDEAQYIKNPDSQTAQAARSLQAEHRLGLTGTPIENRLLDLWSIIAFAMPGVLGNRSHFARRYNQQDDPLARRRLAARVRPFLLRRTKNQVAQDLPDRVEEDLICEMEGDQQLLYRAELKNAQKLLLSIQTQQDLNEQRFNFLTSLLRLRQICCHPGLVNEALKKAESAKVEALLDLLEPLMQQGYKVLVFSQFLGVLDILRSALKQRRWKQFYLAGETEDRGELVADFQRAEGAAVFLVSLKAGGFGLNLTAASYVVLFDPWWNPAVEMQAIDRTHRIGQTSKVIAYRLLIKNSIEQKIRQLQRTKAALAEDVLGEEKFAQSLSLDDLRFLLEGE